MRVVSNPSPVCFPVFLGINFPTLVSGLQKVSKEYRQFAELRAKTRHFSS